MKKKESELEKACKQTESARKVVNEKKSKTWVKVRFAFMRVWD